MRSTSAASRVRYTDATDITHEAWTTVTADAVGAGNARASCTSPTTGVIPAAGVARTSCKSKAVSARVAALQWLQRSASCCTVLAATTTATIQSC